MRIVFLLLTLLVLDAEAQTLFGREPNRGQFPADILFFQRSTYNIVLFTRDSMRFVRGIEVQIENTSPQSSPALADAYPTDYNYILGNDSSKWIVGAKQYRTVRLPDAFPGISASWRGGFNDGLERLTFNLAPGADPSLIRVRFKNLGDMPFEGPNGIWFTGGSVPGVFRVEIAASQGNPDARLAATLKIANSDTLTISSPNLDRTRPSEFVLSFPNFQEVYGRPNNPPPKSSDGNRYLVSSINEPSTNLFPTTSASDAVAARLAEDGTPLWVTILGGSAFDQANLFASISAGLVVSGLTDSLNFPVSTNAPAPKLLAERGPFFAFLNSDSGLLRSSTYAPLNKVSGIDNLIAASGRDAIAGGASIPDSGFLLRWRPAENVFIYNLSLPDPVRALTNDSSGTTYYATFRKPRLTVAAINESGSPAGRPATYSSSNTEAELFNFQFHSTASQSLYAFFSLRGPWLEGSPNIFGYLANFSLLSGSTGFVQPLGPIAELSSFELNPAGEPRILTNPGSSEILPTSGNAPLVAPCLNSDYYARFSPTGRLLYASYVPQSTFNFNGPEPSTTTPSLSCAAATAGRKPIGGIAPGQMITLTGGNFGPAEVIYSTLGPDGKFPATLNGYTVRIGETNAPIFAIARGLIAVQVPFETKSPTTISITGPDAPAELLTPVVASRGISLFDTGDIDNPSRLPALAALNQDGTINSKSNPAKLGSIVSVFGSGLDLSNAPLATGGFNPLTAIHSNPLFNGCRNCTIMYLGSAPGLSTAVFQANLQLTSSYVGTGTRPLPLSFAVNETPRFLSSWTPYAIVWVKD